MRNGFNCQKLFDVEKETVRIQIDMHQHQILLFFNTTIILFFFSKYTSNNDDEKYWGLLGPPKKCEILKLKSFKLLK